MDERKVIRCSHCKLNQFETKSGFCRKCSWPLPGMEKEEEVREPVKIEVWRPPVKPEIPVQWGKRELEPCLAHIKTVIRLVRSMQGMSQRDLAQKILVPRTYISKIENGKAIPTISSFKRFALAFHLPPARLLEFAEALVEA